MNDGHHITAGNDTLFKQTSWTALEYMSNALRNIDGLFGAGYAKAHPELVGHYMLTCAIDFHAGVVARAIESVSRELSDVELHLADIASEIEIIRENMPTGEPE